MPLGQAFETITGKLIRWMQESIAMLPNLAVAVLVLLFFWTAARLSRSVVRKLVGRFTQNGDVSWLLGAVIYLAEVAAGVFIALGVLHLDKTVTSLLTGVGILGLTLGFALQDVTANLMAGLLIELRHPFRVNDVIETNSFFGRVRKITLRDTEIAQLDGQVVLVPNKEVFDKPVINHSASPRRRVDIEVNVSSRDNLDEVLAVARDALSGVPGRDPDQEIELFFKSLGDATLTLMMRFWIDCADELDFLRARSTAIHRVKQAFDAHHLAQHA
jgi:small conductance mechanosensitive channel